QKSIVSFFSPVPDLLPVPTTDFPVLPALADDESGAIGTGLSPMDFEIDKEHGRITRGAQEKRGEGTCSLAGSQDRLYETL
ncbi:unnamed protein product, partial [Pylaiella littoralis]